MRAVRRSALLLLAALSGLTSCGIPTTGVVQAGVPASGVAPTVRVYFVADGGLFPVRRRITSVVGVEAAVELLLQGPTLPERFKGITTRLPQPAAVAPADGTPAPGGPSELMEVTAHRSGVTIELSALVGRPDRLGAAQIICTALDAQRITDPGTEPLPVTVTGPDHRRVEGTGKECGVG
ncbi:hypothetical protein ABZT17_23375 [Streptomyces sp. NPDC005648]|uniref:hypothetical protein n=1 Tax=Streptomyces sp. NPDC005648 TaxID=3157044 RepID=UPI0033BADC46